jgi:hypothetical protein
VDSIALSFPHIFFWFYLPNFSFLWSPSCTSVGSIVLFVFLTYFFYSFFFSSIFHSYDHLRLLQWILLLCFPHILFLILTSPQCFILMITFVYSNGHHCLICFPQIIFCDFRFDSYLLCYVMLYYVIVHSVNCLNSKQMHQQWNCPCLKLLLELCHGPFALSHNNLDFVCMYFMWSSHSNLQSQTLFKQYVG